MSYIFSPQYKFSTWRRLWVALAESEKELGLNITDEQINELKANINNINFEEARQIEKEVRHDVMSHVKAYGLQCDSAKGIIHLGATSAYVGDNTDVVQMNEALKLIRIKLVNLISNLKDFAIKYKDIPTLGFTHFQAAQLTTVGKRSCLWAQDLIIDLEDINFRIDNMKLRGVKGTTGTQASFLSLFENDHEKVKQLDKLVCEKMGYKASYAVSGQTYTRKLDYQVLSVLSSIAQSMHKMTNDIRLLQSLKELEEPFGKNQIGSSAMAYKRNPMRSERIASLSKFVIAESLSPALVQATQWLERSLDDSANKRLAVPQAFMAVDAILEIGINVTDGLVVYENIINKHINEELPFMATETILMEAVKRGGDRQELHEVIREYSMQAAKRVKQEGKDNNLLELILEDCDTFKMSREEILDIMDPKNFIGRAPEQVVEFVEEIVNPAINEYKEQIGIKIDLNV
jgi:adenylosuccinate lyase